MKCMKPPVSAGPRSVSRVTQGLAAVVLCAAMAILLHATSGYAASSKRWVELDITLPGGETPRVVVREDEGALIRLKAGPRFGFVPTIQAGQEPLRVVVAIWDVDSEPNARVGQVETVVGGPMVQSETAPSFGVRVTRVIKRK